MVISNYITPVIRTDPSGFRYVIGTTYEPPTPSDYVPEFETETEEFYYYFYSTYWSSLPVEYLSDFWHEHWADGVMLVVGVVLILIPEPTTTAAGGAKVVQILGQVMLGTDMGNFILSSKEIDHEWMKVTFENKTTREIKIFYIEYFILHGSYIIVEARTKKPFGVN